jgi:uncharacterized protein (TIGR02996 family)
MSDLRQALEGALFANPDDLASHMAYADYLAEQGDPRGEFIQVQLALEDEGKPAEERKKLQRREQELLAAHEAEWLGGLAPVLFDPKQISEYRRQHGYVSRWRWARGWLDDLYLWQITVAAARALAGCSTARPLRRLRIDFCGYDDKYEAEPDDGIPEGSEYPSLYPLARAPFLPQLRAFQLGEAVDFENAEFEEGAGEGSYNSEAVAHGLVRLVAKMDRVEELHLYAQAVRTDKLFALPNLTHLRVLVVYHNRLYPLEVLAANPALRNLTALRMHPANNPDGSCLPLAGVRELVHSPHLTSLKELHLRASDLGDEGCAEIVRSGILKRLEVLDLRFGRVTDAGARLLAECPDVRRLRRLNLEDNQLTDVGRAALRGPGIDVVRCEHQLEVGSDEYLYSGDME